MTKRFIPIFIILILLGLFFYFDLQKYLTFTQLKTHHEILHQWTQMHFIQASLAFIGIYIVMVAISVPGASLLTLTGGYLFGLMIGSIYVVISATIGATLIFLATKTAFGTWLAQKATPWLKQLEKGFQKNALYYLLFLRLIPLFPFWLINIVPGLLNVRLRTFVIATFIGIMPGSIVYVSLGSGLGSIFVQNQTPNFSIIFEPAILLPIIGLAILSLVPLLYKRWKGQSHDAST